MKTIGIIGAGDVGSQIARLALTHGYHVVISNSRGPETLFDAPGRARVRGPRGHGRSTRRRRETSSSCPYP